jgi:vacuolar-type H+-ATPase subunit H
VRAVIERIISTETEAKQIIEKVRAEADRILSDVEKKAQDMVARARQEARVEAEKLVAAAIDGAELEKQERLTRAISGIESQIRLEQADRERAAEGVVRCVCGQR